MQGRPNNFVPELVYTRRVSLPILERVHKVISNYCFENDYYIENKNRGFCLYKDVFYV